MPIRLSITSRQKKMQAGGLLLIDFNQLTTGGHFKPGVSYHVKEDGKAQNKQLSIWHFVPRDVIQLIKQ